MLGADVEAVYKYTPNNTTMTGTAIYILIKYLDNSNFLYGLIDGSGNITIQKIDGGANTTLATGSAIPARSGTSYWVRMRSSGNVITYEHFTTDPRANLAATPNGTVTHTLAGGNATKYGTGIVGRIAMSAVPQNTNWRFDDFSMGTYNALANSIMTVTNIGNFPALAQYTFSNKMSGISLVNTLSNRQFSLEMDLLGGGSRTLDTSGWTLKDENGDNKFSELGITSDWVEIDPGDNPLVMSATGLQVDYAASTWRIPQVSVKHRHSWF